MLTVYLTLFYIQLAYHIQFLYKLAETSTTIILILQVKRLIQKEFNYLALLEVIYLRGNMNLGGLPR